MNFAGMAEGVGFEPTDRVSSITHFPGELRHQLPTFQESDYSDKLKKHYQKNQYY